MMKSKDTKGSHFKFLLAITPHIEEDGAVCKPKFQCSSLLDKEDIDEETLQAFLNAGAHLVPEDIDKLIDSLPDNTTSTAVIKTITDTVSPEQVNSLCKKSLDANKFKFAAHFISCGAQPEIADIESCVSNWKDVNEDLHCYISSKRAQLLNRAIWSDKFDDADKIVGSTLPLNAEELDLTSYLKSTSIPVDLVRKLLDNGVDPNKGNPLDAAFGLDDYRQNKLPLICLLVEKGAKVDTHTLFKITEIALGNAGKTIQYQMCSYMIDVTYRIVPASAHGRSQLKRQKLRVGGYTEKEVQLSPRKGPPRMQVSCQRVPNRLTPSLRPCFVEANPTVEKAYRATNRTDS